MSSLSGLKFRSSSVKSLKSSSIINQSIHIGNNQSTNNNQSIHNKNNKLQIISKNPFEISPSHIVFNNIQSNKDYEIKVQIRNLTKKPQRIRFSKFNNSHFNIQAIPQSQIAAGLSIFILIKYQCTQQISQMQTLHISSNDGFIQQLNINAYPKKSKIIFQPFINLGFVQQNSQSIKQIIISNQGQKHAQLKFISNQPTLLTIQPQILNINSKNSSILTIKYKPNQAGYFKGIIQIKSTQSIAKNFIQVVATSLQKARFIINPNKINSQQSDMIFDFRTVYAGQKKIMKAFIINNSPKPMQFKSQIKKGLLQNIQQVSMTNTPLQQAHQQKQKVFKLIPQQGIIQPFAQFQLQIKCQSKIGYKQKAYVQSYAIADFSEQGSILSMRNANNFRHEKFYQYTLIIKSQQQKPLLLHLKSIIACPQIKINKKSLLFGDCLLKQIKRQQLTIQNRNKSQPIKIIFPKIPYIDFIPNKFVLDSQKSKLIQVIFKPKTIGKIDSIQLIILNDIYTINLRCMGFVRNQRSISQKLLTKLSLQKGNQSPHKVFTSSNKLSMFQSQKSSSKYLQNNSQITLLTNKKLISLNNIQKIGSLNHIQKDPKITMYFQNKQKFSKLLTTRRQQRQKKQSQKQIIHKYSQIKSKLEKHHNQSIDDQGLQSSNPVDIQFQLGSIKDIKQKQPKLSKLPQKLFVIKHIGSHQPDTSKLSSRTLFHHSSQDKPRKIFPQIPQILNQKRQIQRELSIQQLQLIQIPQTKIYFGQVYVKSDTTKCFWLKNNTRFAISCKIIFDSPQLNKSYFKAQIIPTCQQAGFPIIFYKTSLGDFFAEGYYIINDRYKYKLSAIAKVGEVVLSVNKQNLKFQFTEGNLQMKAIQNIILTNPGNSQAKFRWVTGKDKLFIPQLIQGIVQPKQSITIPVQLNLSSYTKSQKKLNQISIQQKLSLKILDGQQKAILCLYQMLEPKYTIKCQLFSKKSNIFLNNQLSEFIELKNSTKQAIVIHFILQNVQLIGGGKIRLMPDQIKKIKIKFIGIKVGQFNCGVSVVVRGGIKSDYQFTVNVISPQIQFSTQQLSMEPLIVRSTRGQSFFTLSHSLSLPLPIIFDFRSKKYNKTAPAFIQNMDIKLLNQNQSLQIVTPKLKSQQDENIINQNLVDKKIDIDEIQDNFSNQSFDDEQETLQKDQYQFKRYRLLAKPGNQYKFRIDFVAPQIGKFKIQIPLEVQNSLKINNSPILICQAIQPKFVFQPAFIDFKKKYLGLPERSYPKIIQILVKNENYDDSQWALDCQVLQKKKIFTLQPSSGCLKPNQNIKVKALFNPLEIGQYEQHVSLYIRSSKQQKRIKFSTIVLKGIASQPQIYFNKRQVIMPVVPLGIQTSTFFRILNDGYDNLTLQYEFDNDVMGLDVKVSFPQGTNIGISRQKLRIDLSWKFDKPISFTLLLTFKDDIGRKFTVPISGTADNSILTNYMYMLRNENKFRIKQEGALHLIQQNHNSTMTSSLQRKHSSHSLKSNSTNRSIMSYLGIAPINPYVLSTTLEYIKKYLNENMLNIPINQFPQSIVQNDGKSIIEVINVASGKGLKFNWIYQGNSKGQEKLKKLIIQYTELIKMLKLQGAMLNHIRPEYLLSFQDLNLYLSTLPLEKSKCYMPNLLKINSGLYNYLSVESWTSLLYQILKIHLVSRVSQKNIKSHVPFYKQKQIPPIYSEPSNFMSINQSILLHWCEQAYHQILLKDIRLMGFDKDFKSGVVVGTIIQRYAKNNLTARMKIQPKDQEQQKNNAKIVCQALQQMGLIGHIEPKYIFNPFQRQMVLLIMYLYMYLPAYIPKQKPIIFQCTLGQEIIKSIQLKNPSSKPLKYRARYVGSSNFILLSDQIFTIEPKSTYQFKIKFISKFVRQVKGRVSFVNLKDKTTGQSNNLSGSTIVFELKSQTLSILSQKIWKVQSNLYEPSEYTVQFDNNLNAPENSQFIIKVKSEYIFQAKKKAKFIENSLTSQQQIQVILLKAQSVKVKKGTIEPLSFTYLPLSLHKTKTYLLFSNEFIGQFQHQIQAFCEQPALTAQIKPSITMYSGQIYEWSYMLNPRNQLIQKSKKLYQNLQIKKSKGNNINSPTKSKIKIVSQIQEQKQSFVSKKYAIQIEQNSSVNLVDSFVILNQESKKDKKTKAQQNVSPIQQSQFTQQNQIKFKFACKQPVYQYTLRVKVKDPKLFDIRIYRLVLTILPKPLSAVLQMTSPLRKQIIQQLPFINNTERDWNMKVSWFPGNGFSLGNNCSNGFIVKKQSMFKMPVIFKPKIKQESSAKIIISNPVTLDQFQYQIKGYVQQPLSEDHIDIQCQINQIVTRTVQLVNPYQQKSISLRVQTDIANFQGQSKITIPPNGKLVYPFKITPMICGQFTSCITFWEIEGNQYFWFTISVKTSVGTAALCIDIETQIRQRKLQKIKIPVKFNLTQPEQFQVKIQGQGLLGPQKIKLYPQQNKNQVNILSLEYLPLKQCTSFGSIYLVNDKIGQILIDLNLICHSKPPVIGHLIKSPLGVGSKQQLVLQNPINAKVILRYKNSNSQAFSVTTLQDQNQTKVIEKHQNIIKLLPFQKKTIIIQYIPGSIDSIQKAQIFFFSQEIGNWEYHFSGIGIAPTQFQRLILYRQLGLIQQSTIKFKNPFNYAITVGVRLLVKHEQSSIFKLNILERQTFNIEPHGNIEIPFSFIPDAISQYFCTIKILLSEKIFWSFPIIGVGQKIVKEFNINIKTKCRQNIRIEKHFILDRIGKVQNNHLYHMKLLNIPVQMSKYVNLFFDAQLIKNTFINQKDQLIAQFLFKPMKPFKTAFDLAIDCQNGGRWLYKLHIQSLIPQYDDKIELQSTLMSTATVSFRITNKQKKVAAFRAYFSQQSAHEFSVWPAQGLMDKYGSKGTQIKLTFTPVQYGKDKQGKLIIQTDEMYWSYDVIGRLPKYIPPLKKSVIQSSRRN